MNVSREDYKSLQYYTAYCLHCCKQAKGKGLRFLPGELVYMLGILYSQGLRVAFWGEGNNQKKKEAKDKSTWIQI